MTAKVTLASSRLQLRPWRPSDVTDVLAYAGDEEFSRYLPLPRPYSLDDAEKFIGESIATPWETHPRFAIVVDGHVVGDVNLRVSLDECTAAVGYGLARRLWNRGLMTEA